MKEFITTGFRSPVRGVSLAERLDSPSVSTMDILSPESEAARVRSIHACVNHCPDTDMGESTLLQFVVGPAQGPMHSNYERVEPRAHTMVSGGWGMRTVRYWAPTGATVGV